MNMWPWREDRLAAGHEAQKHNSALKGSGCPPTCTQSPVSQGHHAARPHNLSLQPPVGHRGGYLMQNQPNFQPTSNPNLRAKGWDRPRRFSCYLNCNFLRQKLDDVCGTEAGWTSHGQAEVTKEMLPWVSGQWMEQKSTEKSASRKISLEF